MAHFHFFFSFYVSFFHSCFLFLFFLSSLFFQIWLYEMLQLLHPATIFPSQYLPKHYCDRRPKRTEMSSDEFTEFMKHIDVIDIQQVVERWCISSMVNHNFKDNYVPLVGLHVVLTTLHATLQGNLVTVKELLAMMVPSIPWHLLIGSWVESVSLGCDGG